MSRPSTLSKLLFASTIFCSTSVLAQPGTLDASFGTGGETLIPVGSPYDLLWDLAIQADDKIVVVGSIGALGGAAFEDAVILRFHADGGVDSTFGDNGKVIWTGTGGDDRARAVAIDTDGRMVVAGETEDTGGEPHMFVLRLLADGSFDTSFSGDGVLVRPGSVFDDGTYTLDVACLPDGSILVAGYVHYNLAAPFHNETSMWKCTPTGGTDWVSGWDLFQDDLSDAANGMVVRPDGSNVLGTNTQFGTDQRMGYVFFNSDGTHLLSNYQGAFDLATGNDYATSILLLPDDHIVLAGKAGQHAGMLGLVSNDSLDQGFGTDGQVLIQLGSTSTSLYGALAQPWDKILLTGNFSDGSGTTAFLGRYNGDGTADAVFGNAGVATHQPGGFSGDGRAIGLQSDGRIIVGGNYSPDGTYDMFLARFNNDIATGLPTSAPSLFTATPNPTNGKLTLTFSADGPHTLMLFDAHGHVLRSERMSGAMATLSIDDLPAGIYLLRESGSAQGVRVVRQ
ncbi:MAG TPA: T9SS type A sorting domain-containing protein [Flavobacteriales bacterium]|nr:T9SS type A sorting domain-containing protein [Flavobacteriales bacterium]